MTERETGQDVELRCLVCNLLNITYMLVFFINGIVTWQKPTLENFTLLCFPTSVVMTHIPNFIINSYWKLIYDYRFSATYTNIYIQLIAFSRFSQNNFTSELIQNKSWFAQRSLNNISRRSLHQVTYYLHLPTLLEIKEHIVYRNCSCLVSKFVD